MHFLLDKHTLITSMLWYYYGLTVFEAGYVDDDPYSVGYVIFLSFFTLAVFPAAYRITKKYVIPMLDILEETYIKYMAVMSVLMLIILSIGWATIKADIIETPVSVFICSTLCIAVGSVYTVCFMFLRKLKEEQALRINILKSEHINDIAQEQYKHICDHIEAQKQLRHNFRHQLITLRGLCDEEPGKTRDYLTDYLKQIPEYTLMPICANPILNSIISYYKSTAESDGFEFKCKINLPPIVNISDSDLVTILGNILENALDAGRLMPEDKRQIILNIGFSHKMLGITIDNTFNGDLRIEDGNFLSTKHDQAALGLQSIINIAEKYNGSTSFEAKNGIFYSSVMLANISSQK